MVGRITLLIICFVACFSTAQAELSEDKKALVQALFPSATITEEKLTDFPVYPVYQLAAVARPGLHWPLEAKP
jgi:NosR/NirI family nitrous oxide reductase transcriptional regulator